MYQLIINAKTYEECFGKDMDRVCRAIKSLEKRAVELRVRIVLAVCDIDLRNALKFKLPIYSQNVEAVGFGAHTGKTSPFAVKKIGGLGTLLSHSENILSSVEIEKRIEFSRRAGIEVCVCARDILAMEKVLPFKPDFIAVEPKELIGGNISISSARPELIRACVEKAGKVSLLVGAGVKNREDVLRAVELGAKGILVASGVVLAKNPKKAISDLLEGFAR